MHKTTTTLFIGSDHAGFSLKERIKENLPDSVHCIDMGTCSAERCDYPTVAQAVCQRIVQEDGSRGILVCGTGIGMSMAANRFAGIRAAVCATDYQCVMARRHNNANVLCLGERVTGAGAALALVETFFTTPFEQDRHQRRLCLFDNKAVS